MGGVSGTVVVENTGFVPSASPFGNSGGNVDGRGGVGGSSGVDAFFSVGLGPGGTGERGFEMPSGNCSAASKGEHTSVVVVSDFFISASARSFFCISIFMSILPFDASDFALVGTGDTGIDTPSGNSSLVRVCEAFVLGGSVAVALSTDATGLGASSSVGDGGLATDDTGLNVALGGRGEMGFEMPSGNFKGLSGDMGFFASDVGDDGFRSLTTLVFIGEIGFVTPSGNFSVFMGDIGFIGSIAGSSVFGMMTRGRSFFFSFRGLGSGIFPAIIAGDNGLVTPSGNFNSCGRGENGFGTSLGDGDSGLEIPSGNVSSFGEGDGSGTFAASFGEGESGFEMPSGNFNSLGAGDSGFEMPSGNFSSLGDGESGFETPTGNFSSLGDGESGLEIPSGNFSSCGVGDRGMETPSGNFSSLGEGESTSGDFAVFEVGDTG